MVQPIATQQLLTELQTKLAQSDAAQRKQWAIQIIAKSMTIKKLSQLLYTDQKTATRFSWLLTDIILVDPKPVLAALPYLFGIRKKVSFPDFEYSFAKYWNLAGIPKQNLGTAIDLLLGWLGNTKMSILTRRHSLLTLAQVVEKYPDLKNEFIILLEDILQKEKPTNSLQKLALRYFNRLVDID